jgi:tetratricopeptide (TPR) repeat protein
LRLLVSRLTGSAPGLAILVAAAIFLLYGADRSLAGLEQSELKAEARSRYLSGNEKLKAGRALEAGADFERALVLKRNDREYEVALATAEIAANQLDAASETLNDVLRRDSNDARANLLMARAMVAKQQYPAADSYYHRAIYGSWMRDGDRDSTQARLELVEFLAVHGTGKELLSELLPLESEAATNRAVARRLPELFLRAGSPSRALTAYRSLIEHDPDDVQAYAGLARTELLLGNYSEARGAFRDALRRRSGDPVLRESMELAGKVMALDPTPRRLESSEKYRRSMELLGLSEEAVKGCVAGGKPPDFLQPLLDSAERFRTKKAPGSTANESAEERLDLAEKLWQARLKLCASAPGPNDALALVMEKLAQQ